MSITKSTHYSFALSPFDMRDWVEHAVPKFEELLQGLGQHMVPVFCFKGMSGITYAQTFVSEYTRSKIRGHQIGMIYVRKDTEVSHGQPIEHNLKELSGAGCRVLVFVDDFVASGKTKQSTIQASTNLMDALFGNEWLRDSYIQLTHSYPPQMMTTLSEPLLNLRIGNF